MGRRSNRSGDGADPDLPMPAVHAPQRRGHGCRTSLQAADRGSPAGLQALQRTTRQWLLQGGREQPLLRQGQGRASGTPWPSLIPFCPNRELAVGVRVLFSNQFLKFIFIDNFYAKVLRLRELGARFVPRHNKISIF